MKQIKFRGWDIPTQTMIDLKKITPLAISPGLNCDGLFLPFTDDIKLMQFTGLHDKDGKEIYEGDIIRGENPNLFHVVEWIASDAGYGCRILPLPPVDYLRPSAGLPQSWIDEFDKRIIGNIYENPELLNND